MNTTTRRYPRTLAEAFPDSREASIARAHYGAAITRYRENFSHTRVYAPYMLFGFFVGLFLGMML